jgi:hypothetical protein
MKQRSAVPNAVKAETLPVDELEALAAEKWSEYDQITQIIAGRKEFNDVADTYAKSLGLPAEDMFRAYRTSSEKGELVRKFNMRKRHRGEVVGMRGFGLGTGSIFVFFSGLCLQAGDASAAMFTGSGAILTSLLFLLSIPDKKAQKQIDADIKQKIEQTKRLGYKPG